MVRISGNIEKLWSAYGRKIFCLFSSSSQLWQPWYVRYLILILLFYLIFTLLGVEQVRCCCSTARWGGTPWGVIACRGAQSREDRPPPPEALLGHWELRESVRRPKGWKISPKLFWVQNLWLAPRKIISYSLLISMTQTQSLKIEKWIQPRNVLCTCLWL